MHSFILAAEPINIGGMAVLGIPVAIALFFCRSLRGRYRTLALIPTAFLTAVYVGEWFAGGNLAGVATIFVSLFTFGILAVIGQRSERARKAAASTHPEVSGE